MVVNLFSLQHTYCKSNPTLIMTSQTFNQLFDVYRQEAVATSIESVSQSAADGKPTWVQLLQRHVQEWKEHYSLECQALEEVKDAYQRIRRQTAPLSPSQQKAMFTDEGRKSVEVASSFQAKRDLIWARQQQELSNLRFSA